MLAIKFQIRLKIQNLQITQAVTWPSSGFGRIIQVFVCVVFFYRRQLPMSVAEATHVVCPLSFCGLPGAVVPALNV